MRRKRAIKKDIETVESRLNLLQTQNNGVPVHNSNESNDIEPYHGGPHPADISDQAVPTPQFQEEKSMSSGNELSDGNSSDTDNSDFSEPSINTSSSDDDINLQSQLSTWYVDYGVKQNAFTALLTILRQHGHEKLPKDCRTILKTPDMQLQHIAGGEYYHFGIKQTIQEAMMDMEDEVKSGDRLDLQINIDGLPIYKSTKSELWPILGQVWIDGKLIVKPITFGVYYGTGKPKSIEEYLKDFVDEYNQLRRQGLTVTKNNTAVRIAIDSLVCDAPATAAVTCVKGHTSYRACPKCCVVGITFMNRRTFPDLNAPLRTDESFIAKTDPLHHLPGLISPFVRCELRMVSQISLDYMHCLILGVLRKILHLWTKGDHHLGCEALKRISEILLSFASTCPSEFSRRPRDLSELNMFKATELRAFLCYTGIVALKGIIRDTLYKNFLLLACATRLILRENEAKDPTSNAFIDTLYRKFVVHFQQIYGLKNVVYNVHVLIHLAAVASKYGSLDNVSGFPFENHLQSFKRLVRRPGSTLQQIVRRIDEKTRLGNKNAADEMKQTRFLWQHNDGPLPHDYLHTVKQYDGVIFKGVRYSNNKRDSCVKLIDSKRIGVIKNIAQRMTDGEIFLVVQRYRYAVDFFDYPCSSQRVGVHKVRHLSDNLHLTSIGNAQKCWLMPHKKDWFVAVELNPTVIYVRRDTKQNGRTHYCNV